MQDKHPEKQVQFVDEVEKAKKKLIMGYNSKSRMCNIDGQRFYPFSSRTWFWDSGAPCFITNDPTSIYDADPINESIEASIWLMKTKIHGKKDVFLKQVDGRTTCLKLYDLTMDWSFQLQILLQYGLLPKNCMDEKVNEWILNIPNKPD